MYNGFVCADLMARAGTYSPCWVSTFRSTQCGTRAAEQDPACPDGNCEFCQRVPVWTKWQRLGDMILCIFCRTLFSLLSSNSLPFLTPFSTLIVNETSYYWVIRAFVISETCSFLSGHKLYYTWCTWFLLQLSKQAISLQEKAAEDPLNMSFSDENSKTNEQLLEVIRYCIPFHHHASMMADICGYHISFHDHLDRVSHYRNSISLYWHGDAISQWKME